MLAQFGRSAYWRVGRLISACVPMEPTPILNPYGSEQLRPEFGCERLRSGDEGSLGVAVERSRRLGPCCHWACPRR